MPGSPADDAGLEGGDDRIRFQGQRIDTGGDVIVAIDGEKLVEEADLPRSSPRSGPATRSPSTSSTRDGDTEEIDVDLEERPDAVDNG